MFLLWILLIILNIIFSVKTDVFGQQARIISQNGHVIFQTAENRNVTFKSLGSGSIRINDDDLISIARSAKSSVEELMKIKNENLITLQMNVDNLVNQVASLQHLLNEIPSLERRVDDIQSMVNNISQKTSSFNRRINRTQNRVRSLERQLQSLKNLLNRNECQSNPCRNGGTCEDIYNGFICRCPANWEGPTCENDVNECWIFSGTPEGCQNGGTCQNFPGSFSCQCAPNWHGVLCSENHDDCNSASNQALCGHGTCINQPRDQPNQAKYKCLCDVGWKSSEGLNPVCVDEDECSWAKYPCSGNPRVSCYNTLGSYMCGPCPAGYTGNGHVCEDIDECQQNNGGCSVAPTVQCVNTPGSRYCGPCPPGFSGNGVTCFQSNICFINNGGCHHLATCISNPAITGLGRECRCPNGYSGTGEGPYGCVQSSGGSTGISEPSLTYPCQNNPCIHGTCVAAGTTYQCLCHLGYTGFQCENQVNECASNPCQNGGTCIDQLNGYTCSCTIDFSGNNCETEKEECGGTSIGQSGEIKYPAMSNMYYRHNLSCTWMIVTDPGKVLNLTFLEFHLEASHGCYADFLQIIDGVYMTSPSLGQFCGANPPGNESIITTHNHVHLWFRTDYSVASFGFHVKWNSTDPVCGRNLDEAEYGTINSPGYPGTYPLDRDCYWTVAVPLGKRIKFQLATLALEQHINCGYDFLEIRDGYTETSPFLQRYCGTVPHPPIVTSGPYAFLHFHSDHSGTDSGFHIIYSSEPGIPGCGGVFTTPQGVITTPNFPDFHGHNLDCDWLIRVQDGERIQLTFLSMDLEHIEGCLWDYVEVRDGKDGQSALIGRYCGTVIPPTILSSSQFLFVNFHADHSISYQGFKATYIVVCGGKYTNPSDTIHSPYYPNPYPDSRECIYVITQPLGKGIVLEFIGFDIEGSHDCRYDYLEVRDGDSETSPLLGHLCGNAIPNNIISSHNVLWLKFKTDDSVQNQGFLASYRTEDVVCGGIYINKSSDTIISPNHGIEYPHDLTCRWIIKAAPGSVVKLSFLTFILENSNNCQYDYVEIFDNSTGNGTGNSLGRYCGSQIPPMKTTIYNIMTIIFHSDVNVAHEGFSAHFVTVNSSLLCGVDYFQQMGTLTSPGYPNNYPSDRDCTWKLQVPSGQQIKLNFTEFDMESSTNCKFDYLEIRNGGYITSPLIGKYCGSNIPQIISHSNQILLRFHSDQYHERKGFKAVWDGTARGCGGELSFSKGSIASPNYPLPYGHSALCEWKILISQGSKIKISFIELDIEDSESCSFDYLEILDGDKRNSKLLKRYCGHNQVPDPIETKRHAAFIKFKTDYSDNGRGFLLSYNADCNNELKGRRGVIESPNFPEPYPHNRNCTWIIKGPRSSKIRLTFSHMQIEESENCEYDSIIIQEMENRLYRWKTIATYCNDTAPLNSLTSTESIVNVHFVSDETYARNGFRLEWLIIGCGGELTREQGSFTSPGYPQSYPLNTDCDWLISVPYGNQIELTINELHIESSTGCRFDALKIFGGPDDTSPELTKFCHQEENNLTFTALGNHILVRFSSDNIISGNGFKAFYKAVAGGCGGNFTTPNGVIHSPNFPEKYNVFDDCAWLITVNEFHTIHLIFESFDVEPDRNCSYDYVAVYDGDSENAPELLKHCGNTVPSPVRSTSNQLFVRMKTDGSVAAYGFKANYSIDCGGTLNANIGGLLEFQPHILTYIPSNNCSWIINSENPGDHVTLTITHLEIYNAYGNINCTGRYDSSLQVFDGDSINSSLIGSYCNSQVPPAITSVGSSLYLFLKYRSSSLSGLTFTASFFESSSACGGNYSAENGAFSSPGFPSNYPLETECIWTIMASPGNKVKLSFSSFKLEDSENCNTDYVEIHENDPTGRLLNVFCGSNIPSDIIVLNKIWIKFRSDDIGTDEGFMAHYNLIHGVEIFQSEGQISSPLYPRNYINRGQFTWTVVVPSEKRIHITFIDLNLPGSNFWNEYSCYGNKIILYDGNSITAPKIKEICGLSIPDPITTTGNQLTVFFSKQLRIYARFMLSWKAVDDNYGGGTSSSTVSPLPPAEGTCFYNIWVPQNSTVNVTSPRFPNGYDQNSNCTWIMRSEEGAKLVLTFVTLDMEYPWWECRYGPRVGIYDGINGMEDWTLINNTFYCKRSQEQTTVKASGHLMKINFLSNWWQQGTGFLANVKTECGGYFYESNGIIQSPLFPESYPPNQHCEWKIVVRPSRTIHFTFKQFDIASSSSCSESNIVFRNGGSVTSPILGNGKYCGNEIPSLNDTSSNQAYIKFVSSPSISTHKGFQIMYEEISVGCGGSIILNIHYNMHTIKTPNYPKVPPQHTECIWIIMGPPSRRIQLDFNEVFDIADTPNCANEYVAIHDGGALGSPLIDQYCNSTAPGTIWSNNNAMLVHYFTNLTSSEGAGFQAVVKIATCGGTFVSNKGTITSPEYPNSYENNMNCDWNIRGPTGHYLTFSFTTLNLPWALNCSSSDHVAIHDINSTGEVLGTYCGNDIPPEVNTSDNTGFMKFISHINDQHLKRFQLNFQASVEECGGELTTPSGSFASPNFPGQYPHRQCNWKIQVSSGKRIHLQFNSFDLPYRVQRKSYNFCPDFVLVRDGINGYYSPRLAYLCGKTIPEPIESSGNTMSVYFYTSGRISGGGFSATYTSDLPAICGGQIAESQSGIISSPINVTAIKSSPQIQCLWHLINPNSENSTMLLSINNLNSNILYYTKRNGCFRDFIKVMEGPSIDTQKLYDICENITESKVYAVPFRNIWLLFISYGNIFLNLSYSFSECGGEIYSPGIITSPNYMNNYDNNIHCAWSIQFEDGQQVEVNFEDFDLEIGPDCNKDYVVIYNGRGPRSPEIGKYCGNNKENIKSMGNTLWIEFVSDESGTGHGFKFSISSIISGCGGIFHGVTADISSMNFPNQYPNSIECIWEISVPLGYHFNITFLTRFDIETSTGCDKDYIELSEWNQNRWNVLNTFCGKQIPDPLKTKANKLRILFHTNEANTGDGFKLKWHRDCGGVFTDQSGTIFTPHYPSLYDNDLYCEYLILAEPESYVVLSFNEEIFSIEDEPGCKYDSLEIYQGNTTSGIMKGIYCGNVAPQKMALKGSALLVFKTDHIIGKAGFELHYKLQECGGNLTASSGSFHPPTYPTNYHSNMNCLWVIYVQANRIIELRFPIFDIEDGYYDCYYDSVSVYDGDSVQSSLLGKFCGQTIPRPLRSTNNTMTILFRSDHIVHHGGFVAVYSETFGPKQGCGGFLNASTGLLSSLDWDHDGKYESNLNCFWRIVVSDEKIIKLSFQTFDIESPSSSNISGCPWDYLEIRDGLTESSPLIDRYCGNIKPADILSSTNLLWIAFISDSSYNFAGFQAVYTSEEAICGGTLFASNQTQFITSPDFSNNYPINIRCQWLIAAPHLERVEIKFEDFELEESDSCTKDYLEIKDVLQEYYWVSANKAIFCGKLAHSFYSQNSSVQITFVSNTEITGKGFKFSYRIQSCNRTYQEESDLITVHNYFHDWNEFKNSTCIMTIDAKINHTISLYFTKFALSFSSTCERSYFEVRDGNSSSSASIAKLCGYRLPSAIHSQTNQLFLYFFYGGQNYFNLELIYTTTDQGRGCGGKLYGGLHGTFSSPFYPDTYAENKICRWHLRVPSGGTIRVSITFIDIGNSTNCAGNYVALYNSGIETEDHLVGTYCGQITPAALQGNKNEAIVKFVTNTNNQGSGFKASYSYVPWQETLPVAPSVPKIQEP